MDTVSLVNLEPLVRLLLLGALLASGPLVWLWARKRGADLPGRLDALTLLTLFLTFDLVLFGAFTRLTDSGLGCPDWPGCYGHASPLGAHADIGAAQSVQPTGPVTHGKAWVEMVHRYLATGVGALIATLAAGRWIAWRKQRKGLAVAWWASGTLLWVCIQGAFGAFTVTMKLYPAVVTAHLLGGLVLLALLGVQAWSSRSAIAVNASTRTGIALVSLLALGQITLGGWVSTNYAVLACTDFPTCHGSWWPAANFADGFTVLRPLGVDGAGNWLSFEALTAIHMAHRAGAAVFVVALGWLAWRLAREQATRRFALALALVATWQAATGISNVVLGWPLLAAVGHTGGAAALVLVLTRLAVATSRRGAALLPAEQTGRASAVRLGDRMPRPS